MISQLFEKQFFLIGAKEAVKPHKNSKNMGKEFYK